MSKNCEKCGGIFKVAGGIHTKHIKKCSVVPRPEAPVEAQEAIPSGILPVEVSAPEYRAMADEVKEATQAKTKEFKTMREQYPECCYVFQLQESNNYGAFYGFESLKDAHKWFNDLTYDTTVAIHHVNDPAKPQLVMLDIDISDKDGMAEHMAILRNAIESLISELAVYGIAKEKGLDAILSRNIRPDKIGYHVDTRESVDNKAAYKVLITAIKKRMKPKYAKYLDPVPGNNMRMPYTHKKGVQLLPLGLDAGIIHQPTFSEFSHLLDITGSTRLAVDISAVVQKVKREVKPKEIKEAEKRITAHFGESFLFAHAKDNWHVPKGQFCPICKEIHHNQNNFINLTKLGVLFYNCRQRPAERFLIAPPLAGVDSAGNITEYAAYMISPAEAPALPIVPAPAPAEALPIVPDEVKDEAKDEAPAEAPALPIVPDEVKDEAKDEAKDEYTFEDAAAYVLEIKAEAKKRSLTADEKAKAIKCNTIVKQEKARRAQAAAAEPEQDQGDEGGNNPQPVEVGEVVPFDPNDSYCWVDFERQYGAKAFKSWADCRAQTFKDFNRVLAVISQGAGAIARKTNTTDYLFDIVPKSARNFSDMTFKIADTKNRLCKYSLNEYLKEVDPIITKYKKMDFKPDAPPSCEMFNMWKGYAAKDLGNDEPSGQDAETLAEILYLIRNIICDGEAEIFDYLMKWLSFVLFRPGIAPGILLLLYSLKHGAGKDTFLTFIWNYVIGSEMAKEFTSMKDLLEKHNGWQGRCKMASITDLGATKEAWAANFTQLNGMITATIANVNPKNLGQYNIDNIMAYVASTNHMGAMIISESDRRIFAVAVNQSKIGDVQYWNAKYAQYMNKRGGDIFYTYMRKNYGLDSENPPPPKLPPPPLTALKKSMIDASAPAHILFLREHLADPNKYTNGKYRAHSATLYVEYEKWCETNGEKKKSNKNFSLAIVENYPGIKKRTAAGVVFDFPAPAEFPQFAE